MAGLNINKKRFIYNTHENAERPYYVSVLLKTCTKPRESVSINNLSSIIHRKLRKEMFFPIPKRAAPYLIETAIQLGVLDRDIYKEGFVSRWGARGYVISTISPDIPSELPADLQLLKKDKLAFLKYYLDADGFALLAFARRLHMEGQIEQARFLESNATETIWNNIIHESLGQVKSDKLRSEIREIQRKSRFLAGKPKAKGKSLEHVRKHKFTPHMEILVDLGIIERNPSPQDWHEVAKSLELIDRHETVSFPSERVVYRPKLEGSKDRLERFLKYFRDPVVLDKILSSTEGSFFCNAAKLYDMNCREVDLNRDFELLEKEVITAYESTRDEVYRLAFLDAIKDIVCVNLLANSDRICEPKDVWTTIEKMRQKSEKDVRYHRDNYGVINYIALTKSYAKNVLAD